MKLNGRPKYILRREISVQRSEAELRLYRAKRDFFEEKYGVGFDFAIDNRGYAHKVFQEKELSVEAEHAVMNDLTMWDMESNISVRFKEAMDKFDDARRIVETDAYEDMTEFELQDMVYGITKDLPRGKSKGCKR